MRSKHQIIGLDIGRASVKAVQVSLHDKRPTLDGAVMLRRSSTGASLKPDETQRLINAMHRRGLTAPRVVFVAPTDALVGGSINLPPAESGVAREKIVQTELSRTHKLTQGTFEMSWWDLPTPASGARIGQAHALALPHATVEDTLELLCEHGLCVTRTVPASIALLAAAQRQPIDPRTVAAVVDLGSTRGHLSLMLAGRVVHERDLPDFNLQAIRQRACELLSVQPEIASYAMGRFGLDPQPEGLAACETASLLAEALEPLTEEIGMSFAYVSHLYPEAELGQLLLTGGGANLPGLTEALAGELELQTAVITPRSLLNTDSFGNEQNDPALTAALGAALCGEAPQ